MFDLEQFRRLRDEFRLERCQEHGERLKIEIIDLEKQLEHANPKAEDNADRPGYFRAMISMRRVWLQELRHSYRTLEQQMRERTEPFSEEK